MNFTPLKIMSWIMGKEINLIRSLKVNLVPLIHHQGLNKSNWERIGLDVKLCSLHLKLDF